MISILVSKPSAPSREATYRACQRANAEPREPIVSKVFVMFLMPRASSILLAVSLGNAEHAAHQAHQVARTAGVFTRAAAFGRPAQLGNGAVRNLVDDAARQGFNGFLLFGRQRAKLTSKPRHFSAPHGFKLFLQTNDGGRDFAAAQASQQPVHLFFDNGFRPLRNLAAPFEIFIHDALEVVNVIDKGVLDVIRGRIDITRYRDIDEEHRPVAAQFDGALDVLAGEQVAWRGG